MTCKERDTFPKDFQFQQTQGRLVVWYGYCFNHALKSLAKTPTMLVGLLLLNCDSLERNNGRRSFFVKFKFSQSQNRNRQFDYLRPTYPLKHVGRVELVDDTQVLGSVEIKDKCLSQAVPFT